MDNTPVVPVAPVAAVREHVREHHGDRVVDPYEWLRDESDPEVVAYLEAENAYADAQTAHLEPLRRTLFREIKGRVKETDVSVPVVSGPWWYYTRTIEGSQYAVHARCPYGRDADGKPGRPDPNAPTIEAEQILLDENVAAAGSEFFSLGALSVSADHDRLAYAIDRTGDERFDLSVIDIGTGDILDTEVTGIGYGVEFSRDGSFVFYTRLDQAWRPYQLWRHRVGTPAEQDELIYEEPDERFWMGIASSRDERWLILALGSKTTSEVWLLDSGTPEAEFHCVAPRREGVEYDVEPAADGLLIVHNTDRPDSDLAWAPLTATSADQWEPLLGSAPGERFLGVEAFNDAAVLTLRSGGLTALRVLPRATSGGGYAPEGSDISFAENLYAVALGDNPEPDQRTIQVVYESFVTPRTVMDIDLATGERTILKRQEVQGGFDPADYQQHRVWAPAPDGTQVPVSVVARRDVLPDGTRPGLLTGYGAYEISSDPYFSVARLSLLDRGVVYAVAHARGGGEMGRAWYDHGKLLEKGNTFTDTIAARDALVASGWVAPDRVGLEGGSAGGLLVGAVINQAPEKFAVAHAAVPFVDALTTILRPDLPLTVGEWEEWGNPLKSAEVYAYMRSYSPYENIAAQAYPTILATTSLHDTRVFFTEPAKWVARLRATATNDPQTAPIVLRTEMAAGHGGRSGRYAAWEQIAWEWAFVLWALGVVEDHQGLIGVAEQGGRDRPGA